jgi:starch phosphorylase
MAERIFPASDISEQISTAGKEASGTGNMKFMMNGALTLGTFDGANVEIVDAVGTENAYIFGVRYEDMAAAKENYDPYRHYEKVPGLRRIIDAMTDGTLSDGNTGKFKELAASLLTGSQWDPSDVYYVLGDFADYRTTRDRMAEDYRKQREWAAKCWKNITLSGRFSSDRTIKAYASEIWRIEPVSCARE